MAESISITDFNTLRGLRTKTHQDRRLAVSSFKPIRALDSETNRRGNIRAIADSDGDFLHKITPESLIAWLFRKKYQNSWNFFYNLTFDAEVILKTLPQKILDNYKRTRCLEFTFNGYKIDYLPSKRLAIRKGHHSAIFFDIAQYYHESLVNAYQNNIGKLPNDYLEMKKKRSVFTDYYFDHYPEKILKYCIQDCKYTKELAQHWIKLFYSAFGFYPARWISSGYLAEKVLIVNNIYIPRFSETPEDVQEFAYNSYFGGRFEILKRGFIGQAYIYDINSAYPFALTKIPDLTRGTWIKRKSIHPNALLGFFKIEANLPDVKHVPPFPFRRDPMVFFPSGKYVTFCTLEELKACEDANFYRILDSVQFLSENPSYPYKQFIENLYLKRLELKQKKDPLQLPLKIILNSIYGKTGEIVRNRIGNLFNPVIFSFITGHARAQLYRFVHEHNLEREVVAFATDSICTTREIKVKSQDLGDFSLDNIASDVFYLQNGFYRFNGKWKQRGFGRFGSKDIEHLDTIERDGKLLMKCRILRPKRLRSSILQDSVNEVGKFSEIERELNLNADKKRLWFERIENIDSKTMNDSMPISMNYFQES
jgi:hypothetical protein